MTVNTQEAQKISLLIYPSCSIDDTVSIQYGEFSQGDCFGYIREKGAIVRFQMDFITEVGNFLCEFETVSMQRNHLKQLFDRMLPGMTPVWATENVLWEDDF